MLFRSCSETSTSISNCRLRLLGSISSFRSGVRLSEARVEPPLRMPRTQRRGVDRAMSRSALISRGGGAVLVRLHDLSFERFVVMA